MQDNIDRKQLCERLVRYLYSLHIDSFKYRTIQEYIADYIIDDADNRSRRKDGLSDSVSYDSIFVGLMCTAWWIVHNHWIGHYRSDTTFLKSTISPEVLDLELAIRGY